MGNRPEWCSRGVFEDCILTDHMAQYCEVSTDPQGADSSDSMSEKTYKILRRNWKFEQELWRAICSLASNSENIKKRLERAYEYNIAYLQPESIPQERNREKLIKIKNKLTKNHTKKSQRSNYIFALEILQHNSF